MNTRLVAAEKIIDKLLTWALANRDSDHEFVICYTYKRGECPKELADAKEFLGETIDHFERIVPPEKGQTNR